MQPRFQGLLVRFDNQNALKQAQQILNKVKELIESGSSPVGITYSANREQTETIRARYLAAGEADGYTQTGTTGANQAEVIALIEKLLAEDAHYMEIGNHFKILPITTMAYAKSGIAPTNKEWVEDDLRHIEAFLDHGGTVLAWQNQLTNNDATPNHPFAVGGGVAKTLSDKYPDQKICMALIQERLLALQNQYGLNSRRPSI